MYSVPASNNTDLLCTQPKFHAFILSNTTKNTLHLMHKCIVHLYASLDTRYTYVNTDNTQVTRVHTGNNCNTRVSSHICMYSTSW